MVNLLLRERDMAVEKKRENDEFFRDSIRNILAKCNLHGKFDTIMTENRKSVKRDLLALSFVSKLFTDAECAAASYDSKKTLKPLDSTRLKVLELIVFAVLEEADTK